MNQKLLYCSDSLSTPKDYDVRAGLGILHDSSIAKYVDKSETKLIRFD